MNFLGKRSRKMEKKGQAEIIGFAIIVLLLIFAFIFFVRIKLGEEDTDTRLIRTNLRANSALNALMKVNVDDKRQMKDLVEDCLEDRGECSDAKGNFTYHLSSIFEDDFNLSIDGGRKEILSPTIGKDCRRGISASPFVIKATTIKFKICT